MAYLLEAEIFQDLTPQDLSEMDRTLTLATTLTGKIFYSPEETGEVLFILKKGRVQIYRISPEGKKLVLDTFGPGSIFGEMSLIGQGMHDSFAEAVEDCVICVISRDELERLLLKKPQISLRFLEVLGQRLSEAERRLEDLAFKSVPARLASLLLRLGQEQGATISGFTHQDLAEMVGTYRETTTATLNQFRSQGLLSIGRKKIEILNWDGLQEVAGE
ncbi:MAG: Crp/Fnr family transcriptional regulator [Chloroflexi bacterium]|nr:Crp/Fnr family transcriptional regulator [Chloroflexota bacterium]